jgi:transposase
MADEFLEFLRGVTLTRGEFLPAAYVKPYVRRQKNDAADAAGICEAVTRPSMRFVGVRTLANQAVLMHHKTREMLVRNARN